MKPTQIASIWRLTIDWRFKFSNSVKGRSRLILGRFLRLARYETRCKWSIRVAPGLSIDLVTPTTWPLLQNDQIQCEKSHTSIPERDRRGKWVDMEAAGGKRPRAVWKIANFPTGNCTTTIKNRFFSSHTPRSALNRIRISYKSTDTIRLSALKFTRAQINESRLSIKRILFRLWVFSFYLILHSN